MIAPIIGGLGTLFGPFIGAGVGALLYDRMFAGPEDAVKLAAAVFSDLEQARRHGSEIAGRDFRLAVDLAAQGAGDDAAG